MTDNAGNSLDAARNLGLLTNSLTFSDDVGDSDNYDYYRLQLDQNSTLNVNLSGLSLDANLGLYRSDGGYLTASSASGTANESISRNLAPGTYYLLVSRSGTGSTAYNLSLSRTLLGTIPADPAGSDFNTARNIGTVTTAQIFTDFIGDFNGLAQDTYDYYRLQLSQNSTLTLNLSNLTSDANLYLYSVGGTYLTASTASGTTNESIIRNLTAGTYYALVQKSGSGGTNYSLQTSATSLGAIPTDNAGTSIETARNLGTVTTAQTFTDFIGDFNGLAQDNYDYYRLQLTQNSTLNLSLSGLSSDANLFLYNSVGGYITASSASGTANESIIYNLIAGTYYALVQKSGTGGTNYSFQTSATSLGAIPTDNAGTILETARNIGIIGTTAPTFTDFVGDFNGLSQDNRDYYRLQLSDNSTLNLNLSGLSSDANLSLYNSVGSYITGSSASGTASESVSRNLAAGLYYVLVEKSGSGYTNYGLQVSATALGAIPVDNAGNERETARDIGTLSSTVPTYSDFLGDFNGLVQDNYDYYKFQVTQNSNVTLNLSGLTSDANLYLYNSFGSYLAGSTGSGISQESIIRQLTPGTYYVYVQKSGSGGTTYSLQTSATPTGSTFPSTSSLLDTAANLGTIAPTQTIDDSVNTTTNRSDYYRLQLAQNSTLNLLLSNLGADANLTLYSSGGTYLTASSASGITNESIVRNLFAGTYFIEVTNYYSNTTNYKLQVGATSIGATPVDNAANSRENARNIGVVSSNQIFTDFIGDFNGLVQDNDDYYRLELSQNSTLNLKLSGLSADANLYLYNLAGSNIAYTTASGIANESIIRNLAAGTYFVNVYKNGSGGTNYAIQVSATALGAIPADNAGDDRVSARNIGVISSSQTFNDFIGNFKGIAQDNYDYYRLELTQNSTLSLLLSGLSDEADLYLYSLNGGSLGYTSAGGTANESIVRNLAAGTYFVNVYNTNSNSSGTNYAIQVSATALGATPTDNVGNDTNNARDIGVISSNQTFSDFVGDFNGIASDDYDYYRFQLSQNSTLSLTLSGLTSDANLYLYNSNGSLIASSSASGLINEILNRNLAAGTYYVSVQKYSTGGTNYSLQVGATSLGAIPTDNAGSNLDTAKEIGTLTGTPQSFTDFVGDFYGLSQDDYDYYRLQLTQDSTIDLTLTGLSSNANLYLYNVVGGYIVASTSAETANESISRSLTAGTYYISVQNYGGGQTNYTLQARALSLSTAQNITTLNNANLTGTVSNTDNSDYYRFILTGNNTVALTLSGLSSNANLYLYNNNGEVIATSAQTGTTNETLTRNLTAGTYYIHVNKPDNGSTNYNLQANLTLLGATSPDNAGDTLETAKEVGILTNTVNFSENVGGTDTYDYYRFRLDQNSTVNLNLGGLIANADLTLYRSNGGYIKNSTGGGTENEVISSILAPGIYYALVSRTIAGGTPYTLQLSRTVLGAIPNDPAGSSFDTARNLGTISTTQNLTDYIGNFNGLSQDDYDYYRLQLSQNSILNLNLSGLSSDANLSLYSFGGNNIASSSGSLYNESIIRTLAAGTYYALVQNYGSGGTNYNLQVSANAIAATPVDNAGNSIDTAKNLGTIATAQTANDFIGDFNGLVTDDYDYYRLQLSQNSTLNLSLSGLSSDANLYLYNSVGSSINYSNGSGNSNESIIRNLTAGIYYARVDKASSGGTNYTLQVAASSLGAIPTDNAGSELSTARNLGTISTTQTLNDFVGDFNGLVTDDYDYYRLQLSQNSTLNLSLTGLSADANLYLLDNVGSSLVYSYGSGISDESIIRNLLAGTYYARVDKYSSGGTNYNLQVSATTLGTIPTDNAGDNRDNARDIGTLSSTAQNYSDFVGDFNGLAQDNEDYYKFQVTQNSTVTLNLTGLSSNADLYLYNSTGSSLASATGSNTVNDSIIYSLTPGTYYVRVYKNSAGGTTYSLQASAITVGSTIPNTSTGFDGAVNIGVLSTLKTYNDSVNNTTNQRDYYRLQLANPSTLNLTLNNLSADAHLYLYSGGGTYLVGSAASGTTNETLNRNLTAGTYFVEVYNNNTGTANYQFQASATSLGAIPADNAGNDRNLARDISTITTSQTFNDYIGDFNGLTQDYYDYYRFQVSQNSTLTLNLTGLSSDANLYLLNLNGSAIASSTTAGTANESITRNLAIGTYYAYVYKSGTGGTNYAIQASTTALAATPVDNAGNNRETARNIGSITTAQTFNDFVGNFNDLAQDRDDYYRLDLAQNSTLNLSLTGLSADANLYLSSFNGSTIVSSTNSGTSNESIVRNLAAGTYFVQVYNSATIGTNYALQVSATALGAIPTDNAGNNTDKARDIGVVNANQTFNDFVGDFNGIAQDDYDYYRLQLTQNSSLNLLLSGLSSDANLYLYNSRGSYLTGTSASGTANENINYNLLPGTYYAEVRKYSSGSTTYNLQVGGTSLGATPTDLARNNLDTARKVSNVSTTPQTFNDFVGNFYGLYQDDYDYYQVDLPGNTKLDLKLNGLTSDANLYLFTIAGNQITSSTGSGISEENISRNLAAGTYFARVDKYSSGSTNYNLQILGTALGSTPPDNAGNTVASARDIGVLIGTQTFNDFIGDFLSLSQDTYDYYRFELNNDSNLNLALSGLATGSSVSLALLDNVGNAITSSSSAINAFLFTGVYHIRVSSSYSTGTNYNLSATANAILDQAGNSLSEARDLSILTGTQTFSDFLGELDRNDYYRFELNKNSTFNLTLNRLTADANIELLNSAGNLIASSTNFSTNPESISRDLNAGTYYLRAYRNSGDTTYNLNLTATPKTVATPFQITSVSPNSGSNAGQTTLAINGNQFTPGAIVTIIAPNNTTRTATQVTWQNTSTLVATFDLTGLSAGAYDVRVVDGTNTANAQDVFNVNSTSPGQLEVFVSSPGRMRPWWTGEVTVTYRNTGNTDIIAPALTLNASNALLRLPGESGFTRNNVQFLAINPQGSPGVLAPGASGTYTLLFRPTVANGDVNFSLDTLTPNESIDWNTAKNSLRPTNISVDAWNVIFNNFVNGVGNTNESYQALLNENADYLNQLGLTTTDVAELIGLEFQQADNTFPNRDLVSTVDAIAPTPGLTLTFGRSYLQSLSGRFTLGAFGRSWTHPWDVVATTNTDGNVIIQGSGISRFFTKQSDGSYRSSSGDYATLTQQSGVYRLEEKGGTILLFRNDGRLNYTQDTNANRITLRYTGTQLTTLTHSNGDKFTFTYNAQGRISKLVDNAGRTTTYSYDFTGEQLVSVVGVDGTTSYTYESSTAGARAYALRSITFPENAQTFFEYDSQGRLTKQSLNGESGAVTYTYDENGSVTITDATGVTTKLLLNNNGQVSQSQNALGQITQLRYDENGNLIRMLTPGNTIFTFTHDSQGNVTSSVNPLGQRTEFTYNSESKQLQTIRDQRGNTISYDYTNQGDLSKTIYTDGSSETFSYDATGNLTLSLNRRGQNITYTYNNRGLLLNKNYANGTTATYTYDSRGNLLTAIDADSNTSYTYDSADRVTRVNQGSGRFLEFTYDVGGRRTKITDQSGAIVNYAYDATGRLLKLTNGSGAQIIGYTYDTVGRLIREDNGNGTYTTYSYDAIGQVLSVVNYAANASVNSRYNYTYDHLGRRTSMTTLEGTTTYGYDAIGQLISVTLPGGRKIEYTYDGVGNRISVKDNSVTTAYTANNLNQYTNVGAATYTYDQDGNLIGKTQGSQTWTYTYDSENRLIGAVTPDGTWTYEYDALGNRIASVKNGQRTEYLVDPTGLVDVVGEYSSTGSLIARYTHGLGLVSRTDGSNAANYYDVDALGSVVGLTGGTGSYLNRYSYLPFGEDLTKTETVANPFEYVGQWGVMDEGSGLDFMRARSYDPQLGRFLSTDPLGIAGGDINFYRYTYNNPITYSDPSGRILPILIAAGIGALIGAGTDAAIQGVSIAAGLQDEFSWGSVGISAGLGAIGGGGTAALRNSRVIFSQVGNQFSHSIPNRTAWAPRWLLNQNHPIGRLNGEYVSPRLHYLIDPFARGGRVIGGGSVRTTGWGSKFGWLRQRWNRVPAWIWASFAGGTIGNALSQILTSFDPNDIIGPAGYGTQGYLTPNQAFPYMIRFENQASATAPAVFVTVTHQIDADLELSTFELGDFGFGNIYIDVPDDLQAYNSRVDLRDTIGYYVDFNASLNASSRTVTWKLTTIDPTTGELPTDPDAGFLPPNNATHDGEGFVNYTILPKTNLTTGTQIDSLASIVFDTNDPINTPLWRNTVDVSDPGSAVVALPATTTTPTFTVSWSGTDNGSGIASYDVYVSDNGGAFTVWQDDATTTSAQYSGVTGHTYAFYSVAKDNVGNLQPIPISAQTSTQVTTGGTLPTISISDVTVIEGLNTSAVFTVILSAASSQIITVQYTTVNGTAIAGTDYTTVTNTLTFNPNQTTQTITVPILNDNLNEPNETFTVNLSTPTNATLADAQGIGAITDTLTASVTTTLANDIENLTLTGTGNINGTGNTGNNIITGNTGNNRLDGGTGTDTLIGNAGNDTYVVDTTTDILTESLNSGMDTIESTVTFSLAAIAHIENLTLTDTGNLNGTGNTLSNLITGNSGNNQLDGGDGNDTLNGNAGIDTLIGGNGDDTYIIDTTTDTITEATNAGIDTISANFTYNLAAIANIENLTLSGTSNINGTGTTGNNLITGNSGNNTLTGLDGNDTLIGGAGIDTLIGGIGDDSYGVDHLSDVVTETVSGGKDTIQASISYSLTSATNIENLTLIGTSAINATGDANNNVITGNNGNNRLDGGAGIDILIGGKGNDTYLLDTTTDTITEASNGGTDTIETNLAFNLTTVANIENLTLTGSSNLNGTGTTANNALTGNSGNNQLDGGNGNDTLIGGAGIDTLIGGTGNDTYTIDSSDIVTETATGGVDTVQTDFTFSIGLIANLENLTLIGTNNINGTGTTGNNALTGNSGNNRLDGGNGNDILNGGLGIDTLIGGTGDDTYIIDSNTDTLTEAANSGTDTVQTSVTFSLAVNLENLTLTGTANINGTGTTATNILTGNNGNNQLDGGDGNDTLNGGLGIDTLIGGAGIDTLIFRFGQSLLATPDRINDFSIGSDKIDLLTSSGAALAAPSSLTRTTDSTTSTFSALVNQVFTDADGLTSGDQALGVNSAALVQVGGGAIAGTYLAINDSMAGLQTNQDLLINLTGYTGTLPVLGTIPVNTLFI